MRNFRVPHFKQIPMNELDIIIISGMSGSGKSTAVAAFEDAGYYCVDNMPVDLLPKFLELPIKNNLEIRGLAFVMDLREKDFPSRCEPVFDSLRTAGYRFEIIFLEADEKTLIRRYSQTRRQHPLSAESSVVEGIKIETERFGKLRKNADRIIDTTNFDFHKLKSVITSIAQTRHGFTPLSINVVSFGFKYGIPMDSDMIIDVRFLQNPYFVPHLKALSGLDPDVRDYVLNNETTRGFLEKYLSLLDYLIPLYKKEGKSYLTIAVGCTGGRHRSVAVSSAVHDHICRYEKEPLLSHRDINR